ncbi:hypothetical protein BGZ96_006669 [Linnemannia gamsii]|uniref:RNI-like protein n=1 Tax=Linnemannia gamsii TaxID=64522 RepID=A0ABQ7K358_9FUNG|nr:hypothetical protein BGZ96_006669 [Linnemannia gamsii]
MERAPNLSSLTVGDRSGSKMTTDEPMHEGNEASLGGAVIPPSLTNLRYLDLRWIRPSYFQTDDLLPCHITEQLIAQNLFLEDLSYSIYSKHGCESLAEILRQTPLPHLQRLTIHCDMGASDFSKLFTTLLLRDSYQEEERKTGIDGLVSMTNSIRNSHSQRSRNRFLASLSTNDEHQHWLQPFKMKAFLSGMPDWDLEELFIKNLGPRSVVAHRSESALLDEFVLISELLGDRQVSIKSLTLLDFDVLKYTRGIYEDRQTAFYQITKRFPLLERLRISPDPTIVRTPDPQHIQDRIRALFPDHTQQQQNTAIHESRAIGHPIFRNCPHLKVIDLSHQRLVSRADWSTLLRSYAPQLETLIAWDVEPLGPRQLMQLVPPTPAIVQTLYNGSHPFQAWAGLQELDISANPAVGSAIHMFVRCIPTLRILRALGVPVNATNLVGFDWVCKDLEILAINIVVPRASLDTNATWRWDVGRDRWDIIFTVPESLDKWFTVDGKPVYQEKVETVGQQESRTDAQLEDGCHGTKRISTYEDEWMDKKEVDTNRRRFEYSDDDGSDTDDDGSERTRQRRQQKLFLKWMAMDEVAGRVQKTHQRQVCQQLGRLTKLRELTLEGNQGNSAADDGNQLIDCLHLTLDTGLDYLRPLQANLEKLVIYQLEEELCGRAEMEWIAQHWVHHNNPVWQSEFQNWKRAAKSHTGMEVADQVKDKDESVKPMSFLYTKFKELIGIDVSGKVGGRSASRAAGNVSWLERQCPHLLVVKDRSQTKSRLSVKLEAM